MRARSFSEGWWSRWFSSPVSVCQTDDCDLSICLSSLWHRAAGSTKHTQISLLSGHYCQLHSVILQAFAGWLKTKTSPVKTREYWWNDGWEGMQCFIKCYMAKSCWAAGSGQSGTAQHRRKQTNTSKWWLIVDVYFQSPSEGIFQKKHWVYVHRLTMMMDSPIECDVHEHQTSKIKTVKTDI